MINVVRIYKLNNKTITMKLIKEIVKILIEALI
jgi:hypothetical protein